MTRTLLAQSGVLIYASYVARLALALHKSTSMYVGKPHGVYIVLESRISFHEIIAHSPLSFCSDIMRYLVH